MSNYHSKALLENAYGERKPEWYAGLLSEVIKYGKPGRILDVGAGLGLFVELARKYGMSAVGLEGSKSAIAMARDRAPLVNIIEHDIGDTFPVDGSSVSNIVLNQVLEHIDEERLNNVLTESMRCLEEGGRLFLYSPSRWNRRERAEPTHINMKLPSELRKKVRDAGFCVLLEPNAGLWFADCNSKWLSLTATALLKLFPHDWVSATANIIAVKPSRTDQ